MNKNLTDLLNKLATDPDFFKKFNEQKSLDDLYKFSLSVVKGYSMDEFKDFLAEIAKVYSKQKSGIYEMLPDELKSVAGGFSLMDSTKLKSLSLIGLLVMGGMSGIEAVSGGNSVYASSLNDNVSINQKQNTNNNNDNENSDFSDNDNEKRVKNNQNSSNNKNENSNVRTKTSIKTEPKASTIKYGQKLSSSVLSGGVANVPGSFDWVDPNAQPTAGEHTYLVKFTPNDNNLSKKTIKVKVKVTKATPQINKKPKAKTITYGEALYKSDLKGGEASVAGAFTWKDNNKYLNAGSDQYMDVVFVPSDEENYEKVNLRVPIDVKKAPTSITALPFASPINYGQPLRASNIYGLKMSTPGSIEWASPDTKLSAGNHACSIIFTPSSDNYESKSIDVNVTVNKAEPTLDKNSFTKSYKPNMVVGDFKLPDGWKWQNPNAHLDDVGRFEARAIHDETKNYRYRSETVFIDITKADPQAPSYDVVYNSNSRLKDISLPVGWHWIDENEVPVNAKKSYKASFNAYEAGTSFYHSKNSVDIRVNVQKAVPKVSVWATQYTDVAFGTDLTTVPLSGGASDVPGTFNLARSSKDLRVGEHMCEVIFTPMDQNYFSVTSKIPIRISKNMIPLNAPEMPDATRKDTSISFDISKFSSEVEFSDDGGVTWQTSPTFSNLSPNTPYHFNIRYKENDSRCAGKTSQAVKLLTKLPSPSAPSAPVIKSRARYKIVMESNDKLEFSIDNGKTWQSSPEFKDLKRNTEYSVVSRLTETDNSMPSLQSESTAVKTNRFPRPLSWLFG